MEGGGPSYYTVLGVNPGSSLEDIKRAYRKLAMQWHPDRWAARGPSLMGQAKRKFQRIQEAYSVLSDKRKRVLYDAGLYDPEEEEVGEGFSDFMNDMLSLMAQNKREEKYYSFEELQTMFMEMAQGFELSSGFEVRYRSGRLCCDSDQNIGRHSNYHTSAPSWGAFGATSSYCG